MRFGVFILLSLSFAVTLAGAAAAADCDDPSDLQTALRNADSVFVARIVSVSDGGVSAVAAVDAVWKGLDLEQTVNLIGGDSADKTSGRTRIHIVGQRYLVVAAWSRNAFTDDLCTATSLFNGLANQIPSQYQDAVGAVEPRLPSAAAVSEDVDGAEGLPTRAITIGALSVVLIVLAAFLLRRAVAFRPELGEQDFIPNRPVENRDAPRRSRRRVAGWASGRFSSSGRDQVARLKSDRKAGSATKPSSEE